MKIAEGLTTDLKPHFALDGDPDERLKAALDKLNLEDEDNLWGFLVWHLKYGQ
jgi:hypothetical protein